jgi:hypothetical protein
MAQTMGAAELRRRAISRALANGGAAAVRRVRYGLYRVASASRAGHFHTVGVDERGTYRCSCEAGIANKVCWAMAAVFIAKVEHASKARVTGPASPAAIPAAAPDNVIDINARARRAA